MVFYGAFVRKTCARVKAVYKMSDGETTAEGDGCKMPSENRRFTSTKRTNMENPFFAFREDKKCYPSHFLRFVEAKSGDGPMGFLAAFNI